MSTFGRILVATAVLGVFGWVYSQAHTQGEQTSVVLLAFMVFLYFVPWFVALNRGHQNAAAIGMLNLLLGWTFLGWAVAMIWASTAVHEKQAAPRYDEPLEQSRARGDITVGWHRRHREVS